MKYIPLFALNLVVIALLFLQLRGIPRNMVWVRRACIFTIYFSVTMLIGDLILVMP